MSKQYVVINDDQILMDISLIFSAIRDANGDWEQVEQDLQQMLSTVQGMITTAEKQE